MIIKIQIQTSTPMFKVGEATNTQAFVAELFRQMRIGVGMVSDEHRHTSGGSVTTLRSGVAAKRSNNRIVWAS